MIMCRKYVIAGAEAHRRGNPPASTCHVFEADEELEPEVLVPDVEGLALVDVVELGAAAVAGTVVELVPPPSEAADALVLSVVEAAGFSEVSLPEPGFILSE